MGKTRNNLTLRSKLTVFNPKNNRMKVVLIIKNVCCNLYITIYIVYKDTIGVRRCHNWCHYFQVTSCQKHVSGVLKPKTDRTEQNRPHFTEDTIQMFLEH